MSKPVNTLWEANTGAHLHQPDWEAWFLSDFGESASDPQRLSLEIGHRAERASTDCSAPKEPHPMCR